MNKLLTIAVPTYNAEKYLRDNLESFKIEEILDDIEILIINDGSNDGSLKIAEEYVKRYPDTYRVITKENGGHGSGINCGIQNANGTYFKVVDADDWVEREGFCELLKVLRDHEVDIVYSRFLWAYDMGEGDKTRFKTKAEMVKPFESVCYEKDYMFDDIAEKLYIKMHHMTIRTEILRERQIHIDENCYYVDTEFITFPIPYVNTICFADATVYMYRIGRQGQSVGLDKMQKNEANYDRVIEHLLEFYKTLGDRIPCTEAKKKYLANVIARVAAGKVKIMLSFPAGGEKKKKLIAFDERLRKEYPDIYAGNRNRAVWLLRKTRYMVYRMASGMVKKTY